MPSHLQHKTTVNTCQNDKKTQSVVQIDVYYFFYSQNKQFRNKYPDKPSTSNNCRVF